MARWGFWLCALACVLLRRVDRGGRAHEEGPGLAAVAHEQARSLRVHAQGLVQLNVRYLNIASNDELPDSLFRPEWPEGTTTVRK